MLKLTSLVFGNYTLFCSYLVFLRYRSKVLSRWLAGLPLQLAHLGSRNPELSTQLIDIIHTAAARANKELLKSLQASALRIYGKSLTVWVATDLLLIQEVSKENALGLPFLYYKLVIPWLNCQNKIKFQIVNSFSITSIFY